MIIKKKKQSVLLSVENLTVCDFFFPFISSLLWFIDFFLLLLLFVCGSLLSHKMSKELHDNKEKTTGTSLF